MQIFNYASYIRAFENGVSNPNMTYIARALFEPIFNAENVYNRSGYPYVMTSTMAKAWYDQTADIPKNIKKAAGRQDIIDSIGDYFAADILGEVTNQNKESQMYLAMSALVEDSNLAPDQKGLLMQLYQDGDRPEFLGRAFLFAIVANNREKVSVVMEEPIDTDIRRFKEMIKKNHPKPKAMQPPEEVKDHEMGYVHELYRVYHQVSGEDYVRPEDLDSQPKLRRDFDRQRKDYYLAETIHRELRDTIRLDESEGFDLLKDEVYEGIITTRDKYYSTGFDRMTAVMEHASLLPLSNNLQDRTLDWVGAGEKKGVCHMLVNDKRISWMEEDEDGAEKTV